VDVDPYCCSTDSSGGGCDKGGLRDENYTPIKKKLSPQGSTMVVWLREHQTVLLVNNRVNCSEKQQQEESKKVPPHSTNESCSVKPLSQTAFCHFLSAGANSQAETQISARA